jgi:LysM repeat protein
VPGLPTPTQETEDNATPVVILPSPTPVSSEFPHQLRYRVVAGDTVSIIARRFGSSVQAIIDANGLNSAALIYVNQELIIPVTEEPVPTPLPSPIPTSIGILPTPVPPGFSPTATLQPGTGGPTVPTNTFTEYTVQPGDTLSRIAAQYNTSVTTLTRLNGILNPDLIKVNQVLSVPGVAPEPAPTQPAPTTPSVHVVQPGENLFRISLRYGVTVEQIAQVNGVANINQIFVGQVLTLP